MLSLNTKVEVSMMERVDKWVLNLGVILLAIVGVFGVLIQTPSNNLYRTESSLAMHPSTSWQKGSLDEKLLRADILAKEQTNGGQVVSVAVHSQQGIAVWDIYIRQQRNIYDVKITKADNQLVAVKQLA
jgi:hypothetical protein